MITRMYPGFPRWLADAGLGLLAVGVFGFAAFVYVHGPDDDGTARPGLTSPPPVDLNGETSQVEPGQPGEPTSPTSPSSGLPDPDAVTKVLVLGDESARVVGTDIRWVERLGGGSWDVDLRARPLSGYLAVGTPSACGLPSCPGVGAMLQIASRQGAEPDVVVVTAGVHDVGLPVEELTRSVRSVFAGISRSYPDAAIVVIAPLAVDPPAPTALPEVAGIIWMQAAMIGASVVEPGQPFLGEGTRPERLDRGSDVLLAEVQSAIEAARGD